MTPVIAVVPVRKSDQVCAMNELRILSPTAILGYGFPIESFQEEMKRKEEEVFLCLE